MKSMQSATLGFVLAAGCFAFGPVLPDAREIQAGQAQATAAPAPGGGTGARGRASVPGASPAQVVALAQLNAALADLQSAVSAARVQLATATFAPVKSVPAITAAVERLRVAEVALATRRAEEFATLQAGPNKLNPAQVAVFIAAGPPPAGARAGGVGAVGAAPGGAPSGRGN